MILISRNIGEGRGFAQECALFCKERKIGEAGKFLVRLLPPHAFFSEKRRRGENASVVVGGERKKVALIACMRKLLTILNAMLRNEEPWRKLTLKA